MKEATFDKKRDISPSLDEKPVFTSDPEDIAKNLPGTDQKPIPQNTIDKPAQPKMDDFFIQTVQSSISIFGYSAFLLRPDGSFFDVNAAACQSLGFSHEELLNLNITDIVPNLTPSDWEKQWAALAVEKTQIYESQQRTKAGGLLPVEINASYLNFNHKDYVFFLARDITKRKNRIKEIEESHQLIDAIMENTSDAICSVDAQTFAFTSFNQACNILAQKNLGVSLSVGMTPEDFHLPKHAIDYWYQLYQQVLDIGFYKTEMTLKSNGQILQMSFNLLKRDQTIYGISILSKDITEIRKADEVQRHQLENIKTVLDATSTGTWELNVKTKELTVSQQYTRNLGYESNKVIQNYDSWASLVHPDDLPYTLQKRSDHFTLGTPYNVEYRMREASGKWHWVQSRGLLIERDSDGRPLRMVGTHLDIQERKNAEEALQQQEAFFRTAFENAKMGVIMLGPDACYLRVNESFAQLVGYRPEELIGSCMYDLTFPEDVKRSRDFFERMKAGEIDQVNFEKRYIHKDGHAVWVNLSCGTIRDRSGNFQSLIVYTHDIADRKKAEEALHESEALFRNAFENATVGACIVNEQGRYVRVNQKLCEILGYAPGEVTSMTLADITYPDDLEMTRAFHNQLVSGQISQIKFEKRYLNKNGSIIWAFLSISSIHDQQGQFLYNLTYVQDITDYKKAELNLERQNRELAELNLHLEQNLQDLTSMRTIDSAIASSFDIHFIINILLTQVIERLAVNAAQVLAFDPINHLAHRLESEGFLPSSLPPFARQFDHPYSRQLLHNRQVLKVEYLATDFRHPDWNEKFMLQGFTSYLAVPLVNKDEVTGVLEIFNKLPIEINHDQLVFLEVLARQAAIAIENTDLFEKLQSSNIQLLIGYDETVEAWAKALDAREMAPEGHSLRLGELTAKLAKEMGMRSDEILQIRRGALLHDIGNLAVPDAILRKPTALTEEEWGVVRQHPRHAYEMLRGIYYLLPAADIPYAHHEHWDGSGYPRGLKGEAIPLAARIFSVIDVWEALISDRPYRPAWSKENALNYIRSQSGILFDPQIVKLFLKRIY